jgi:hypothetical protein
MSWRENRRRKRTWYKHYRRLCDQLVATTNAAGAGSPVAAEAIIKMFFDLYEERKLHKRRRVANSAFESLELAAKDSGLTSIALTPTRYSENMGRPPAIGEFGAASRTSTAPPEYRDGAWKGKGAATIWVEDVLEAKPDLPKPGGGEYVTGVPGKEKEDTMRMKDNRDKSRSF